MHNYVAQTGFRVAYILMLGNIVKKTIAYGYDIEKEAVSS